MKLTGTLLVVTDIERSKTFYANVLGLSVIADFGANTTLSGGLSLQTCESWCGFTGKSDNEILFGGNNAELYFETDNYDVFLDKLNAIGSIDYVHPPMEHRWGQRGVRLYDPDKHIIEVSEDLATVCRRFIAGGLSIEETAVRMDVPKIYVDNLLK